VQALAADRSPERDAGPGRVLGAEAVADRLAVPCDQYIALMDSCRTSRTLRVDAYLHRDHTIAAIEGNRLKAQAQIATGDPPMSLEHRRHPFDRSRRNDQNAPPRSEYGHADRLACGVESKAAFSASPHGEGQLDPGVNVAAAQPKLVPAPRYETVGTRLAMLQALAERWVEIGRTERATIETILHGQSEP
jgi:hypothetical protein